MTEPQSAAESYKELIGLGATGAEKLQQAERRRAEALRAEVAEGKQRQETAEAARDHVRTVVEARWRTAIELFWNEKWMRVTPRPGPDPGAPPATPEQSVQSVQHALTELAEAMSKTGLFARRVTVTEPEIPPLPDGQPTQRPPRPRDSR